MCRSSARSSSSRRVCECEHTCVMMRKFTTVRFVAIDGGRPPRSVDELSSLCSTQVDELNEGVVEIIDWLQARRCRRPPPDVSFGAGRMRGPATRKPFVTPTFAVDDSVALRRIKLE